MLDPAISEWAVGIVVEGTGGIDGIGAEGTGVVVDEAGGLEPEPPQCALL